MPDVQEQAAPPALRRELGLRDVTLFAIACIVGTRWIASAAHAGPGSVTLWLVTALLFVAPLAVAGGGLAVKYSGGRGGCFLGRGGFGGWGGVPFFFGFCVGDSRLVSLAPMG